MGSFIGKSIALAAASTLLGACGAGGERISTAPPPPPPPAPIPTPSPTTAAIVIFPEPTEQTYAAVGVMSDVPGGSPWQVTEDQRLTQVSEATASDFSIRYTANGHYEIRLFGHDWDRLVHHPGVAPTANNTAFIPEGASAEGAVFEISATARDRFSYSRIGSWARAGDSFGIVAFGEPTPLGNVPVTGSANYSGMVYGVSDVTLVDNLVGGYWFAPVEGTVDLTIDFADGSLAGSTALFLNLGMNPVSLGTYALAGTVASGTNSYSGSFATSLAGFNFFSGMFTGPAAEETIGSWAVPFTYEGVTHQAIGAWAAQRP